MDWRREDYGYATAAAAAVAFLVYLVAGNFGLVPSPLTPGAASTGVPPAVAPLAAPLIGSGATLVPGIAPIPPKLTPVPVLPNDLVPPAVAITTENGAALALGQPGVVAGTVADVGSNIEEVLVTFTDPSGKTTTVPAEVTCQENGQCGWTAKIPAVVAAYSVSAEAIDAAGNVGHSEPIEIAVLNTGGTVQDVGNVVQRVPNVVSSVVQQLVGVLFGR